jgi:DNA-directed RNA polymerase specialized sigma24 family protein
LADSYALFSLEKGANFMPKSDNQKSINQHYIKIDGKKIYVTEEVYRAYKRPAWAEHKRKEREKRCIISDGKGRTKRCTEDCSKCGKQRTGSALSLERFKEEGFEITDRVDIAELIADKLLLEELYTALKELDPEEHSLIDALFFKNRTERDYAADIGLKRQSVNKRKKIILEKLRVIMETKK